jgi:hypothetical protein
MTRWALGLLVHRRVGPPLVSRLVTLGSILAVVGILLTACGGGSTVTEQDFLGTLTSQSLVYSNILDSVYGPLSAPEATDRLRALEEEIRAAKPPTERTKAISDELLALVTEMEQATKKLAEGEWSLLDYQAAAEDLEDRNAGVLSDQEGVFRSGTPLLNKAGPYWKRKKRVL